MIKNHGRLNIQNFSIRHGGQVLPIQQGFDSATDDGLIERTLKFVSPSGVEDPSTSLRVTTIQANQEN